MTAASGRPLHSAFEKPGARLTMLMLTVAIAAAAAAGYLANRAAFARLEAGLEQTLIVSRRAIESEIERFRYLPRVLGEDVRIRRLLTAPQSETAADIANAYLERVAAQSGAAQLYVLDDRGLTLSASNYREAGSFVGNNYSFRPYFTDAMARGEGRYYAIGVTTGRPGYFLSARLTIDDSSGGTSRTGVVVAKVELGSLEAAWRAAGAQTAIVDRSGVVVLSGNPAWKYRPLYPLDPETRTRIARERTYDGVDLSAARPLVAGTRAAGTGSAFLAGGGGERLFARFKEIAPDDWLVVAASGTGAVHWLAWFWAVVTLLFGLLATGGLRYVEQRRVLLRLRLKQTELLERMVEERTRELARENDIRRRTELELRAAQEGLIHSEKMAALGRMSSAIVHEVSQPLAALEATLATAEALAGREGAKGARDRVLAARALIRRMQRMVRHLKGFARKDAGERARVDVDEAIRNALDVTAPRAKTVGVAPSFAPRGAAPVIFAVQVKIEQVLINLVINALDAVEGREAPRVAITRRVEAGQVEIEITDNGGGIEPEVMPRIAEAFFSTKLSGGGLGLGLSISHAILREFGGGIRFESAPGEGTAAVLSLPLAPAVANESRTAAA